MRERGYLFTGDLVYKDVLFAYCPSTDPEAYPESMERVAALPAERVFPAHHSLDTQPELLVRIRDAFRNLKAEGKLHHGGGQFDCGDFGIWISSRLDIVHNYVKIMYKSREGAYYAAEIGRAHV